MVTLVMPGIIWTMVIAGTFIIMRSIKAVIIEIHVVGNA